MPCRHGDDDPACSGFEAKQKRKLEQELAVLKKYGKLPSSEQERGVSQKNSALPASPNPDDYEIEQHQDVGKYLVLRVRYPSCAKCAYEGNKVLVIMATMTDALRWRHLDPHFRDPNNARLPREAPPPIARFPASKEGWEDAIAYAHSKDSQKAGVR